MTTAQEMMVKYQLIPYKGSVYVSESELIEKLDKIIQEAFEDGKSIAKSNNPDDYEPVVRHFKD